MADVKLINIADDGEMSFEIIDVDVCIVNSLRRVMITHIPTLVFRGFPHKENRIQISKNNSKFNNEYIKHRISCIPIFSADSSMFEAMVRKYQIKLGVVNDTSTIKYVTTENFVLYDKETGKPISSNEQKIRALFPADPISRGFIPICCLMPKISEADESEEIQMVIDFSIGTAKEDACWNTVTKCCFENKRDEARIQKYLKKDPKVVADYFKNDPNAIDAYMKHDMTEEEKRDFEILDAQRIYIPNHYIMRVESIGVYSNDVIIRMACDYMISRLEELNTFLADAKVKLTCYQPESFCIYKDTSSVKSFYVLYVQNDDYTIGKVIEKYLYAMFKSEIYYVSFKKEHPHDTHSLVSFAFHDTERSHEVIFNDLRSVSTELIRIYRTIQSNFRKES